MQLQLSETHRRSPNVLLSTRELPLKLLFAPKYIPSENSYTRSENSQNWSQSIYSHQLFRLSRERCAVSSLLGLHTRTISNTANLTSLSSFYSSISNTPYSSTIDTIHLTLVNVYLRYASPQRYHHLQSLNGREGLIPTSKEPFFPKQLIILFPNDTGCLHIPPATTLYIPNRTTTR